MTTPARSSAPDGPSGVSSERPDTRHGCRDVRIPERVLAMNVTTTRMSRGQRLERQRHDVAVCVAVMTLIATLGGWTPSSTAAWTIVIVAIAVGLPHGAFDVVIGPRLTTPTLFFAMYLAAAVGIVLFWLATPALGMAAFFTSSWYHFARGDAVHHHDLSHAGDLLGVSTAGCAVGLPLMLHAGIVTPVLSDLMFGTVALTSDQVVFVGSIIAALSLVAGLVAGVAALRIRRYSAVVEIATVALVAATVHPLVSFAIYFALWHAPRHLITLDIDRQAWWRAGWATVGTLLAGAGVWRLVEPAAPAAARVVFIGLAALTWPHLALTELLRSRPTPRFGLTSRRILRPRVGQRGEPAGPELASSVHNNSIASPG